MRSRKPALVLLAAAAALAFSLHAAGKAGAKGSLTVNGRTIALAHASAWSFPSLDGKGRNVGLLLSDRPAPEKTFREYAQVGPGEKIVPGVVSGAWKALHIEKALDGVTVTIAPGGKVLLDEILVGSAFEIGGSEYVLEAKEAGGRISGTLRTAKPVIEAGEYKVALDVTFDVPVGELAK